MSRTIVIVGGGSAGWLSASIIAAANRPSTDNGIGTKVILVESPNVATLGVGEGTWPTMRDTLKKIGISENEFLRCCDASFKQGSQFIDWQRGEGESYYHPFTAPNAYGDTNLAAHWLQSEKEHSFTNTVCTQGYICDYGRAPKQAKMPEYAYGVNYGYHLDAAKFVKLLQKHCVERLAVEHTIGHVEEIVSAENGNIESITLASGESIVGDLYLDCTGFSALLIGKHFNIPYIPQSDYLFNDTALAMQVEYATEATLIASCTKATAKSSGWIWDIALPSRRGIGYTFSSQHSSIEKAEEALAAYIKADPHLAATQASPRKISFKPGYRETFWHKNCIAIGVSAGFVEPLEASALVLIEKSAEWISTQIPQNEAAMRVLAKRFNTLMHQRWVSVIDFLKLHYVISQREDSDYWRDHRRSESIPSSLQDSLELWKSQVPWMQESSHKEELFSAASIQFILYGMDFPTDTKDYCPRRWEQESRQLTEVIRNNRSEAEKLLGALPSNRELLNCIRQKQ